MARGRRSGKKNDVPRTEITIVSGVQEANRLQAGTVVEDLTLTSSALLYADHVRLYSMTAAFLRQLGTLAGLPAEYPCKLFVDTMLNNEHTSQERREQLTPISALLEQLIATWESTSRAQRRAPDSTYNELKKHIQPFSDQLRFQYFDMWNAHGGDQLEEAEAAGQLTIMTSWIDDLFKGGDLDQELLLGLLESQAAVTEGSLMFDSMMGGVVSAAQKEEVFKLPPASRYGIRRTATGTAMISYLPTFSGTTISDVLEAKNQIRTPLDNYKQAVKDLEQRLEPSANTPQEFKDELDFLWHDHVERRVKELSEAFQDTKLPRISAASKGFVRGAIKPGMVFLVGDKAVSEANLTPEDLERIMNVADGAGIASWLTPEGVATASVASGIMGAVNGWRAATKKLDSIGGEGLFYLVDTNNALNRKT
ncbi:hypothetical protein ACXZ66_13950 (plasmid) [Corynebacterium sp. S7]